MYAHAHRPSFRFELIKELLKNRLRIVWCMRLARTEVRMGRPAVVRARAPSAAGAAAEVPMLSQHCVTPATAACCCSWCPDPSTPLPSMPFSRTRSSGSGWRLRWRAAPRRAPSWTHCTPRAPRVSLLCSAWQCCGLGVSVAGGQVSAHLHLVSMALLMLT